MLEEEPHEDLPGTQGSIGENLTTSQKQDKTEIQNVDHAGADNKVESLSEAKDFQQGKSSWDVVIRGQQGRK